MTDDLTTLSPTPDQCRRARGLLGWDMLDLAEASGVGMVVILRLEDGREPPAAARVATLRMALEDAGVESLPDGAMRLLDPLSAEGAILPGPLPRGVP